MLNLKSFIGYIENLELKVEIDKIFRSVYPIGEVQQ